MERIILTQQESDEYKNIFDTASSSHRGNYKISDIAQNPVFVSTISQYDDAKKVRFVLYMLNTDFRREKDYALYYGFLQNIFKKKMKMTEEEIVTLCDIYHNWFDMFDAVGIKGFVTQALKNLSSTPSGEIKQHLHAFCIDIQNADIAFAPQRAKTREAAIEKIEAYLKDK